jgi:hypothetical protein
MGYHAPTPQAGRVTDSDGGGMVRVGELDFLHPPPPTHSSNLPSTDFSADHQCLGGGGGGLGSGTMPYMDFLNRSLFYTLYDSNCNSYHRNLTLLEISICRIPSRPSTWLFCFSFHSALGPRNFAKFREINKSISRKYAKFWQNPSAEFRGIPPKFHEKNVLFRPISYFAK